MIIGLGGLAVVAVVYGNRDELKGRPRGRELAMYVAAVAVAIGLGVGVIEITAHQTDICGTYTNCGMHAQDPPEAP